MEDGAVITPLTSENPVPQGVRRDTTAPQQNDTQQQDPLDFQLYEISGIRRFQPVPPHLFYEGLGIIFIPRAEKYNKVDANIGVDSQLRPLSSRYPFK